MEFTQREREYCQEISKRDRELREFFAQSHLSEPVDPGVWYEYLSAPTTSALPRRAGSWEMRY